MNIRISGRTSAALNDTITQRLEAALGQHEQWIDEVGIRLWDENGPRHGEDQFCRIDVRLRGRMNVMIEERGDDPYALVSTAADRVKQAVGRKIARHREHGGASIGPNTPSPE